MSDSNTKSNLKLKCYDFYVTAPNQSQSQSLTEATNLVRVECPDFAILLDHTIGVIWNLMKGGDDAKTVDRFHLIWAMKFLEGIKTKRGHVSKDVDLLKTMMRRLLIQDFAESDVLEPVTGEGNSVKLSDKPSTSKDDSDTNEMMKTGKKDEESVLEEEIIKENYDAKKIISDENDNAKKIISEGNGVAKDLNESLFIDEGTNTLSVSEDDWFVNRNFLSDDDDDEDETQEEEEEEDIEYEYVDVFSDDEEYAPKKKNKGLMSSFVSNIFGPKNK